MVEAELRNHRQGAATELINLRLPDKTCSGLSEPDRSYLQPHVHDRLEAALKKIQPDLVVVCYGMNRRNLLSFQQAAFQDLPKWYQ